MISRLRTLRSGLVGAALLFAAALGAQAIAPTNVERVSVSPTEAEGNLASGGQSGVSADGRYVIFASEANNFGAGFSGGSDIYVRDRQAGFTELVSRGDAQTAGGRIANGASDSPSISSSGRYAAFATLAGNLVATAAGAAIDTNGRSDIYFRDRRGAVVWVSPAPANAVGDGASTLPKISGDGGTVVFQSTSTNLVAGDTNVQPDVFAATLTMSNGLPQLFSVRQVSSTNVVANGASTNADVSEDGSLAVFQSAATNLVTGDDNGETDIFLRDLSTGAIRIVSRATDEDETTPGELGDGPSTNPAISADGRFVAFLSEAANLVEVDANDKRDVFVRDLVTNTTTRVSINDEEIEGDEDSGPVIAPATQPVPPDISDDGNVIVFTSAATNLVEDDTNEQEDVFAHDVTAGSTSRVSVGNGNVEADLGGSWPSLSGSGRHASFATASTNLADEDLNAQPDIYLATLGAGSGNNSPPVADAGFDFEAPEFETVTLDGSGTFDLDEDELTFLWTQMGGPDVELNGATTDSPFFDAPIVAESATLVFQLEVSDGINPPVTDAVTADAGAVDP